LTNPQDYPTLAPIVAGVVYLLTVMLTTVLAGSLVKLGHGYGTTIGSTLFKNHRVLFALFIVEAVSLSVAFTYLQLAIGNWLWTNIAWVPTIIVEAFLSYYVWFCFAFGFNHQIKGKEILLPQIVLVLNYLGYLPLPFRP